MNVYLLTHGEYSAYTVIAAYDEEHKDECDQLSKLMDGQSEGPFILNGFNPDEPPLGKQYFELEMCRDGSVADRRYAECPQPLLTEDGKLQKSTYELRTHKNTHGERKSHWRVYVAVYADSFDGAVKIANEIRIQILAGAKPESGLL